MSGGDARTIARWVLNREAEAIIRLIDQLDAEFERAVALILQTRGRVVVTGIGKSGYIGRKLAATLASTGTPAFFVHAAEAVHGDLGMITGEDVVVAISNSGETEEVLRIVPAIKKIGARLIAITGGKDSSLARESDAVLQCRVEREVDPLNLAPTASSTAALAMADAFAVSLMAAKEFTAEDFHALHPGGSLGRMLEKTAASSRSS